MRSAQPTSCYFTPAERRVIAAISEKEERAETKIVQFAVRVFAHLYEQDRSKALEIALTKAADDGQPRAA